MALEKTRSVLDAVKSHAFANEGVFENLLEMQTLEAVMAALNAMNNKRGEESLPAQVFASMFTDEEWSELEASERAITNRNEGAVRTLRLKRQYSLFWDAHAIAVDVNQMDDDGDEEQAKLVKDCKQVVGEVLNRMGMSDQHQVALVPAPASSSRSPRSSGRAPAHLEKVKQIAASSPRVSERQIAKQKQKKQAESAEKKQMKMNKVKTTAPKKRVTRVAEEEEEEEHEEQEEEGSKKAKVSSDEVDEEEEEGEGQK